MNGKWLNGSKGYTITFYFKATSDGDSNALALFSMSNASKRFVIELRKQSTGVFAPYIYSTNGSANFTGSGNIKKNYWYSFSASWNGSNGSLYFLIAHAPWSSASSSSDKLIYGCSTTLSTMLGSSAFFHVGIGTPITTANSSTYLRGSSYSSYNFIGKISPIQIEEGIILTNGCSYSVYQSHLDYKPVIISSYSTTSSLTRLISTTYAKNQTAYDEFVFLKPNNNQYYKVLVQRKWAWKMGTWISRNIIYQKTKLVCFKFVTTR